MPVINTTKIPVSTFRSGRGGHPPYGSGRRQWHEQWDQCPRFIRDNFLGGLDSPPLGPHYSALEVVLSDALIESYSLLVAAAGNCPSGSLSRGLGRMSMETKLEDAKERPPEKIPSRYYGKGSAQRRHSRE